MGAGRCHLFHGRAAGGILLSLPDDFAAFDVGGVAAGGAGGDGIFPGLGQHVELVGELAADGAGVSVHFPVAQAHAGEDAVIGVAAVLEGPARALVVAVEGITVLHDEFAAAHEAEAGADFIAEFGLNLVRTGGQLLVGAHLAAEQIRHHFLVRRAKAVIPVVAVLEAQKLTAVMLPAAGFLPQIARLHHGQQELDKIHPVHFLADDLLNLPERAQGKGHIRIDAARQLADHARADEKLLADDLGVGRGFLESGNVTGTETH